MLIHVNQNNLIILFEYEIIGKKKFAVIFLHVDNIVLKYGFI